MYHHTGTSGIAIFRDLGRLLKLVDRTDLGSVGENRESSSLSPPTFLTDSKENAGVAQW